ncbi:hypothetical protein [uncultured Sphingomonas sp.]|uniref:hypothetical protein n=1 Tax=uncultured Sphingomonas sp. TaxID=158754 RepID=UPI0035CC60E6
MIARLVRVALPLLAPLVLAACVLAPGKFTSSLVINADRTFTYSYTGEVYAFDADKMMQGMGKSDGGATDSSSKTRIAWWSDDKAGNADDKATVEAKNKALADALSKEAGYRKAEYLGNGKFMIDYQVGGRLDHAFVFPYNLDAGIIIPFIVVEVRANGTVRVKAPGFANDSKDQLGGASGPSDGAKTMSKLDGTFTLDTDAEIISQNNEAGVQTVGGRRTIAWKATPLADTAPLAVLKLTSVK